MPENYSVLDITLQNNSDGFILDLIFSVSGPQTHDLCFFDENTPDGHTVCECDGAGDGESDIDGNNVGTGVSVDDIVGFGDNEFISLFIAPK